MEYRRAIRHAATEAAKGAASGCITHFLIGVAAAALLGGAAHNWGLSGAVVFFSGAHRYLSCHGVNLGGRKRRSYSCINAGITHGSRIQFLLTYYEGGCGRCRELR